MPEENGGKVNFNLVCPSCQAMHPLDITNCDIYEDLELDTSENRWTCTSEPLAEILSAVNSP